jgi:hypothetical protein
LPTRIDTALDSPTGIMNISAAKLMAIRCAAAGTGPSRPISRAAITNRLPSTKIATAMGTPTFSNSQISRQSGFSSFDISSKGS